MKTLTRLKGPVLGALLGALAALPIASMASSSAPAAFPEPGKMVKVIVPFVAGGGVDSAARLFAEQLRKQLGTTVIVASHDLALVKRMRRRVLVLDHGKLADDISPEDFLQGS